MPRPAPLENLSATTSYTSNRDYQNLTPRTPHSRAGRAEEGRPALDLADGEYELEPMTGLDNLQLQQEPLLTSSASDAFPNMLFGGGSRTRKGKGGIDLSWRVVLERLPLVLGSSTALLLLFLIVLSLKKPDALRNVVGATPPTDVDGEGKVDDVNYSSSSPPDSSAGGGADSRPVLSYTSYSSFPLTPIQYLNECIKWHANSTPVDYWGVPPSGAIDVPHKDDDPEYQKTKIHTHLPEMEEPKICSSTITYMLDGYIGLAADLALMAQVAGLAREVSRIIRISGMQ